MAVALDTPLFCCSSIISQALRAAIVAAELPLRGKLRAKATIFSIDQLILEVLYQCLQTLLRDYTIKVSGPELPRARRVGKTVVPDRACSVGCLPPTSNPAARAARAAPTPTHFVHGRRFAP